MKTEDVKFVTVSTDTYKVFVALKNGKNVMRYFDREDTLAANRTLREGGHAARVEFVVNMINKKYMRYEEPKPAPMCYEDERFFWLKHLKDNGLSLTDEEEEEYKRLLDWDGW